MTSPLLPSRTRTAAARISCAVAALAVTVGLAACGSASPATGSGAVTAPTPAATSTSVTPTPTPTATATATGTTAGPDATSGPAGAAIPGPAAAATTVADGLRPVRVRIPAIGVDSALVDLGIGADKAIEVPTDPARVGWLDTSPAPGQQGPAVLAGHVDSKTGPAVFYHLKQLAVGDAITVTRRDGSSVSFTVDGVQTYAKSAFPTEATYGPVPGPALRLITCGGSYVKSAGGYQDNVVVFAS
ncbi:MAG: class F sortase [Lapillicoccus sp.]